MVDHPRTVLVNYVAFESFQNGFNQIFVQNIITGQTVRVTNGFNGANPNGSSYAPVISADGRYVVFHSLASNLVPGDNNNHPDIFLYEVPLLDRVNPGNPLLPNSLKFQILQQVAMQMQVVFIQVLAVQGIELFLNLKPQTLLHLVTHPAKQIFIFDQNGTTASG